MKKATRKNRRRERVRRLRAAGLSLAAVAVLAGLILCLNMASREPSRDENASQVLAYDETLLNAPEPTKLLSVNETSKPIAPIEEALEETPLCVGEIDPNARADGKNINLRSKLYDENRHIESYVREPEIHMIDKEYASIEGVTTFRGDNLRNNAAFGTVPKGASKLSVVWKQRVGGIDEWTGVGWTGQAALVRWPEKTKAVMNIKKSKKEKEGLIEVIYAALDGRIRFFDIDDGENTRDDIVVGAPIKGSVTVDPRGFPLMYCGQGIDTVHGKSVRIGTRIFSLIDQKVLFFLKGRDDMRTRNWYAFDAAPLIDGYTDTMLQVGENGLLYTIDLNTNYDEENGKIGVNPHIVRYAYKSSVTKRPGMENSLAVYDHYAYFADNSGLLQCVDLNDMTCKWAYPTGDDTDATTAVEKDEYGVWLYTANEIDLRGSRGMSNIRCFNAMTGEVRWQSDVPVSEKDRGGAYGSPSIGKHSLSDLVFYDISKTKQGGTLYALDKKSGQSVWSYDLKHYSWSTPLLIYDETGAGYVVIANSRGIVRLLEGQTGKRLDEIDLGRNIEGSPAAFNDMIVVGTRGGTIYGIKVK